MQQTKEILKQIRRLEISTKQLVDGLITGNYHSIFKGNGIEFSEIREYVPGDDIRSIDWKVTARYNHPYVKEFIEERELHVYFVLDMSGSGSFGNNISKKRKSLEIAASLMFAALRNNDSIGVFLITDSIEKFIPARKGKKHVLQILSTILAFQPESNQTNLKTSFAHISKIIKKKSIMFVFSDFFDQTDFFKPLKILRNKHDLILFKIIDLREQEIPEIGLIHLEDEETGEQLLVNTSDSFFRQNYSQISQDHESTLVFNFKKLKIDFIKIISDEKYEIPLKKFFQKRNRK